MIIRNLLMLAAVLSVSANALAYDFKVDGIYYSVTDFDYPTVSVTYQTYGSESYSGNIVIPEYVEFSNTLYNVGSIGGSAFYGCSGLTSVTIPNSVTSIGGDAFRGCSGLTSVIIPNASIGEYAFRDCNGLTTVIIRNGAVSTSIGEGAFRDCGSLNSITIGGGVTSIGVDSFRGCKGLTSITIPNSVTSINTYAFHDCDNLNELIIEDGEDILDCGYIALNIETLYLGREILSGFDFVNKSELKELIIAGSITSIDDNAFDGCSSLASVTIGGRVNAIGYAAFEDCDNLTNVALGNNVTEIGGSAFFGCSLLKTLIIPNSVTSIGDFAFYECRGLTSVTLSNRVTSIGYSSFGYCSSLKSIIIPNSVTSIDETAFLWCNNLYSVTIGTGIQSIGNGAFNNCSLKKVIWLSNILPRGFENVSAARNYVVNEYCNQFENTIVYPNLRSMFEAGGLKYVPVSPSERTCDAIDCTYDNTAENIVIGKTVNNRGIEMTLLDAKDYVCYGNDSIKTLQIKEYAGNIGECSFDGCSNLETVNINDMIGSIGDEAFYDCASLKGIGIPNTVVGIGKSCFSGCSSLEYATIGLGISLLPESCFRGCSSLPEIVIPSTVGSVGNNAFYGCSALARVDIADRQTELVLGCNGNEPLFSDCPLDSVYIGGNISYGTGSGSGYSPFYRNTSLRAVKITDQETEISENEFYGCTGLERVELGDGIESIGNYAFSGCSALESFTFGNSLATIGNEAFSDCTAMTRLVSKTEVPPVCGSQALDDINKWTCELFVPQKSLEAYKAAEQWKEFFFIKGDDSGESSGIDNIGAKEEISVISRNGYIEITGVENQEVEVYNLSGQLVYGGTETTINVPAKGIYIVKVAGQTFKVAL